MLVISLFLALALEPAANVLARRGWRRGLATATVFAVLVVGVVVFVVALGALLAACSAVATTVFLTGVSYPLALGSGTWSGSASTTRSGATGNR
jgi:hypothetical protein